MISFNESELYAWLAGFLLPFARIAALMSSAPLLSSRSLPARFRIALALAITLAVAPSVPVPSVDAQTGGALAGINLFLLAQQVLIGVAIGFAAKLMMSAFEVAGEVIGLQMGLSYAGFFDPQSGSANAIGRTYSTIALFSFVSLNGPLLLIAAVLHSFTVIPIVGSAETSAAVSVADPVRLRELVAMGENVFATALALALPLIAMLLLINLVLGAISRIAPQLNIFSVGFPVTVCAGLLLLAAGLPLIERPLHELSAHFLRLLGY